MVSIEMDSQGDEVAASFGLNFDPAKLGNPVVTLGAGVPDDAILTVNTNDVGNGRLGVLVDSGNAFARSATANQVVTITFDVAADAAAGPAAIAFGFPSDSRIEQGISDAFAHSLKANYADGSVNISGGTAASPSLSGRVLTSDGRGIRNAAVVLTDSRGVSRQATTGSLGYYRFDDVQPGETYVLSVAAKRYSFAARTVGGADNLAAVDFVAQE